MAISNRTQKAHDAYVYGIPLVMNYTIMYSFCVDKESGQYKAPFNTLVNARNLVSYKDTAVVTPNSDTLYSIAWLDLRTEPLVLNIPDIDDGRYYSVQLIDSSTYTYGYIGSRSTGNKGGKYIISSSELADIPDGITKVFTSGSPLTLMLIRTQLFGPDDLDNVITIQDGYALTALSTFMNTEPPSPAPAIDFERVTADDAKSDFGRCLDIAMNYVPVTKMNEDITKEIGEIGLGPYKTGYYVFSKINDIGFYSGKTTVDNAAVDSTPTINNWSIGCGYGNEADYNGDWLKRAIVAKAGIYANNAEEAVYPVTRNDKDGNPLIGTNKYTLTFAKDDLPPVNSFWSVTMYDSTTQLLVENPINRYVINSAMLKDMDVNADGTYTIYIQNEIPENTNNWLPAPAGGLYIVMRLYWPKTSSPSILPIGSGTWQPPYIIKAT